MARVPKLAKRWLRAHGAVDLRAEAQVGVARAGRFPAPVSTSWGALVSASDRLAPSLVLGRPGRASRLDDATFARLEHGLQHHALRSVRLAYLLVRSPLIEARYPDDAPADPGHPLLSLQGVIRQRRSHANHTFDTIVIGSGAGGAPVARSLAEGGQRVAIVESGGLLTSGTAHGVVERYFLEQGVLGSLDRGGTALVLAGNALGGTTAINSGTSLRPRPERLEAWDADWGTRFGDGALEAHLDRVSGLIGIAAVPEALLDESARIVRRGLEALGRSGSFPLHRNAPDCQGSARCCFGCPTGAKMSTDRAFLPQAVQAGATLFAETLATGIRVDGSQVRVLLRCPDGVRQIRAARVIIAAGALATPGLLRANRLGTHWRIAGDSLRIHPATKVFGWMPEPLAHGGVPQALGYHPPDLPRVTFEGAHTPAGVTATVLQAAGDRHRWWMEHHDHLANYGLMVRDRATGSVREVGGRKVVSYAVHDDDARDAGAGLMIAAEALFAAGAERLIMPVMGRPPEVHGPADLAHWRPADFTRRNTLMSGFHPQGTAGIGRVVDADLRVMGTDRVYVCDASVLPDSPGVNPQVTIMALSLRLADQLLAHA